MHKHSKIKRFQKNLFLIKKTITPLSGNKKSRQKSYLTDKSYKFTPFIHSESDFLKFYFIKLKLSTAKDVDKKKLQ